MTTIYIIAVFAAGTALGAWFVWDRGRARRAEEARREEEERDRREEAFINGEMDGL